MASHHLVGVVCAKGFLCLTGSAYGMSPFMICPLPVSGCKDTPSSHGLLHWECVCSMPKVLKPCHQNSGFLKGQLAEPKGRVNAGYSKR